jgi:iron complex transport system permease protein
MFSNSPVIKTVLALLFVIFLILTVMAVLQGPADIPLTHIAGIIQQWLSAEIHPDIPHWQSSIILDVRLPRVIIALFAGASLALCGLVMQGMFRNPLASP